MSDMDKGLASVVANTTRKSKVDGEQGRLYYVGYSIGELASQATFEEVVYLLWNEQLPNAAQVKELQAELSAEYEVPAEIIATMRQLPKEAHPMSVLRTGVSMLGNFDPEADDNSPEANRRKSGRLTAKTPTLVAAWSRLRQGKEPIAPRADLSLAANFVYMLTGEEPLESAIQAIDAYLILLADHGLNASTFASRVITSTDADIYSAITGGIGALKGFRHGGANEAAMRMFLEIGEVENVENFFQTEVKGNGRKIMGIGHRVYKIHDPRATVLRERAEALAIASGNDKWFQIASKLEALARADDYFIERKLYANVDYYSAIVLYTLNLPTDFFTPLFAMARIPGWTAHVMEQWEDNVLIRPKAQYLGELDRPWIKMEDR